MTSQYHHTQTGYLILVLIGTSFLLLIGIAIAEGPNWVIFVVMGGLAVVARLFGSMTIEVDNGVLRWYFGPGFWKKHIPLDQVEACEAVRNRWWYGWGIRYTPYGWLYTVSGLSAVQIRLKGGKQVRLGTDEPQRLLTVCERHLT